MTEQTKKQHWIPKFIVKKWSNNANKYKFYDTHIKRFGITSLEDSRNDIFNLDFLYENEKIFKINEIEKGLSKIESDFAKILQKKILKNNNYKVIINRLDLKIIKLYWLIENYRSWVIPEKAYNLQGDILYNTFYKDKTKEEIDQEFLENLHYLVFDVFDYIKSNVGFLPKNLEDKWKKQRKEISELIEKFQLKSVFEIECLQNQNPSEFSKFASNKILNRFTSIYIDSCLKIIKISDNINYNFLLTDSRTVQFFGTSYIETGLVILEIMPITPRYIIAFLKLNEFDKTQPNIFAKGSFWDKKFPGLFVVNHEWELNLKKEFLDEFEKHLSDNPKIEENELDLLCLERDLATKKSNNKDLYYYPIYELTTNEQVHLINAMLHSQTYKYVTYLKGKDLLKAIETIKFHHIYRIEDRKSPEEIK